MGEHVFMFKVGQFNHWLNLIKESAKSISSGKFGKSSKYNLVELHVRGDETDLDQNNNFGSSYNNVPLGNYYLKFFYENKPVRVVNLYHNKEGDFIANGRHPIFISELDMEKSIEDNSPCPLYTVGQIMREAIYDVMSMIAHSCINDTKPARYDLLENACNQVMKFREIISSHTTAHALRIANRVVFLPKNVNRKGNLVNKGKWNFNPNNQLYRGSFTNVFSDPVYDIDKIESLFNQMNIKLGTGSESSGAKGSIVVDDDRFYQAKLAYPKKSELTIIDNKYRYHSTVFIRKDKEGNQITLFNDPQKNYARMKSLVVNNLLCYVDNAKQIVGPDFSFNRHYCYLNDNKSLIGAIDQLSVKTTYNAVVVFVEGQNGKNFLKELNPQGKDLSKFTNEDKEYAIKRFEELDKMSISEMADSADCNIQVSEEFANELVTLERSMNLNSDPSSFTKSFIELRTYIEKHGPYLITKDSDINIDTHLAYSAKCPCCENEMSPAALDTSKLEPTYEFVPYATNCHTEWMCGTCGTHKTFNLTENYIQNKRGRPYEDSDMYVKTISSEYPDAMQVTCKNIDYNSVETGGLALRLDVHSPIGIARLVSKDGAKGMSVSTGRELLGSLKGNLVNPVTGKVVNLEGLKVDAIIPYGAFKGKLTGQTIAFARFCNAMLDEKLCPGEFIEEDTGKDSADFADILNGIYDASDIQYISKAFNPESGKFEETVITNKTEGYPKLRIGIVELGVTEINSEFFDVLGEENKALKVSQMNAMAYQVMQLNELHEVLYSQSTKSLNRHENLMRMSEMVSAYKGSNEMGYPILNVQDIRKPPTFPLSSLIVSKKDWTALINEHQLFTDLN